MPTNNRGAAYGEKGEYDHAIEDYTKAVNLKPNYAEAYSNRGDAYGKKGDYDHAIEDCNKAIQLKPNLAEAYLNRGVAYGKKGDYDHAIEDYNRVIQLKPDFVTIAYCNRGEAWLHVEEWDKARADLTTARDRREWISSLHFIMTTKTLRRMNGQIVLKLPKDIAAMLTQRRRSRYPKTEKILKPRRYSLSNRPMCRNYGRTFATRAHLCHNTFKRARLSESRQAEAEPLS